MRDRIGVYPFQGHGEDRLFLARFEFPKFGEDFQISKNAWRALALLPGEEAPPSEGDNPAGFIHFLAGFPIDCVEMLVLIGEYSSDVKISHCSIPVMPGGGATAPIPDFFEWPDKEKLLLNKTALLEQYALFLAEDLPGEPEPTKPHWWFRVELSRGEEEPRKFPMPGEFLGLGIRMMPGEFWGHQKTSPFIYSGNWMDTVYLTSAVITSIIEPTDAIPFSRYIVQWRKKELTVNPTDFAEYEVKDRVTILKDVATEKKSQLWKDVDMETVGETWMVCPISFYHEDQEE
jgi:hypothetical protein